MDEPLMIVLNGTERRFERLGENPAIDRLVIELGFRPDRVALEQNGEIVPRADWPKTQLQSGDRIELVHFVGGGVR